MMHEMYITQKNETISQTPPNSNILVPLPLWRQAPKPKGLKVGLEQTSWSEKRVERSQTVRGQRLNLSSVLTDPLGL